MNFSLIFDDLRFVITDMARELGEPLETIHRRVVLYPILGIGTLLLVEWVLNISGVLMWVNLIIFFGGLIPLAMVFTNPVHVIAVLATVGTASRLTGGTLRDGTSAATKLMINIFRWGGFGFVLFTLWMAVWSYQGSPAAFFPFVASVILLGFTFAVSGAGAPQTILWIARGLALVVIGAVVIYTAPNNIERYTGFDVASIGPGGSSTQQTLVNPDGRNPNPDFILIQKCPRGGERPTSPDQIVPLDLGEGIGWSWGVEAWYRQDGAWFKHAPFKSIPYYDGWTFCSNKPTLVGKKMDLTWRKV